MARKESTETRTSLYRLIDILELKEAVRTKYLEDENFTKTPVTVGGRSALLVQGNTPPKTVSWAPILNGFTGQQIKLHNTTAAAVLIISSQASNLPPTQDESSSKESDIGPDIPENNNASAASNNDDVDVLDEIHEQQTAWALTYGMGYQILDQQKVDSGFGQRIAVRSADPKDLISVTRTTLDEMSRVERSSIPSGTHLRGFGVGNLGELVTRLVASAKIIDLSSGEKTIKLRGADALSIPLSKTGATLIKDLDVLEILLDKDPASDELGLLEQLVRVKDDHITAKLDRRLISATIKTKDDLLSLAWPHEKIDDNGTPTSYKIMGNGRTSPQDGTPDLESIVSIIKATPRSQRLDKLNKLSVILFRDNDGEEPISPKVPARKWLSYQVDTDGQRYCLHDGRWYVMNKTYADQVRDRTKQIFDAGPGISDLPDWPTGTSEAEYNEMLANKYSGLCLDRNLMRSDFHKYGIEPCDVLLNDGTYIHVKSIDSSAPASHLLAQALVSAEVLIYDSAAQADFKTKVANGGWDPEKSAGKPKRVVLLLARKGSKISPESLFTFTQVNLARQVSHLQSQNIDVFVAPVMRHK